MFTCMITCMIRSQFWVSRDCRELKNCSCVVIPNVVRMNIVIGTHTSLNCLIVSFPSISEVHTEKL